MSGFDAVTLEGIATGLAGAALLGGLIGVQRQVTGKAAGFRTHLLVAVGSCAFTEASRLAGDTRIAAGIITGIGFLGAGAIVREGATPHGLTTAASVWCSAAVGLAMGFGGTASYELAGITTVLVLLALASSDAFFERLVPPHESVEICVTYDADALRPEDVFGLLHADGIHVKKSANISIVREDLKRYARWHVTLRSKHGTRVREKLIELSKNPSVRAIETERTPNQ
jgi:putative Mg2+ transporter-C (MgtC) family protein